MTAPSTNTVARTAWYPATLRTQQCLVAAGTETRFNNGQSYTITVCGAPVYFGDQHRVSGWQAWPQHGDCLMLARRKGLLPEDEPDEADVAGEVP
jgi:hypothetical protein